ncbi:beta-glucoside-specific PTS transporter subunit IIABC [Vagococcus salmoninarum]|uniref:beta-glucoside-specific PTS transporter subunit IIABC n=1 Tax=Vagococcus salmoninarum TaxID=2739 RepID=UPI0018804F6E|nr:beta-glucoside-specific PTS transporter subunit IIABC [Vagococcus salmoninarum]MBE9387627.1 PTS glucose transporter subunit IIA [Vagococcus salmoninarum]
MATHKETAQQVVEKIGGKSNISHAWHCVTRLRFNLNDKNIIVLEDIKKIPGVMGAQFSGDQFQVIIGNTVGDVFEEVENIVGTGNGEAPKNSNEGVLSIIFDAISGIFTPIIPALAGTGLLKGFLALSVLMGFLTPESPTYLLLYGLGDTVLYFFPFFLAASAAEKFRTNKYLAMVVAGAMMYPTYQGAAQAAFAAKLGGEAAPTVWKMFGALPVPLVTYTSSVIPIIFAVLLLKFVNNWIKKWMPKSLNLMFTPMFALLIVFPISMIVIGPAGTYLGNFVGGGVAWLFATAGPLAGVVLGATFPLLIITGMHYSLLPIGLNNLATKGYENTVGPVGALTNVAQSGSALAVAIRSKDSNMKQIALSSGISAAIGITEPAMYGVNLKLKRPFYAALAAGGIAGGFGVFMNIRSFGGAGMPGFLSIPAYISAEDGMNVIWFIVSLLMSWILAFVFTLILGFKDEVEEVATETVSTSPAATEPKVAGEKHRVFSPMNGQLVNLKDVPDETFASELVGKGIAIEASDENVYSPVSGTIMMFPSSKHAIGLVSDEGVEILIHIGIDTVGLGGEGFNLDLKQGQKVEKGELLGTVDYKFIKEKGLNTVTMVIVTNTANYFDVSAAQTDGVIFKEEEIIHIL